MESVTTYTPPDILSEMDDDAIHQTMMSNLPADIDKTEGGFAHDFTRPAAIELAEMMITLNEAIQIFFPEWSYGAWLDKLANGVGLSRHAATYATVTLTVTGAEGTTIPQGFIFSTTSTEDTENIEFETIEAATFGQAEREEELPTLQIEARCTVAGTIGNVAPNSITLMATPMGGISSVNNPEAASGGTEQESDDDLIKRVTDLDLNADSSYVGNNGDYRRWALQVDGVGSANVIPEWQGKGTGTVKLIIMDSNGSPANPELIQQVYDHIMSPDDPASRLAPVGAILTVVTAEAISINVKAKVVLDEGANLQTVTANFKSRILAYFEEAKREGSVVYTRVGSALSETAGVFDYSDLTVNEGTRNISVTVEGYPTLGEVTLEEAEE